MTDLALPVLGLLGLYCVVMYVAAKRTAVGKRTSFAYNVAERDIPLSLAGPSLAATWVWATGLFVSSMQAYVNGWVGVLWFTVPNTLAIIIMIPFALMLRRRYPTGLTLSGFMRKRYGPGVQRLYHLTLGGLAVMATALNFLAGGAVLALLLGIPAWVGSALLAVVVAVFTFGFGIRSSAGTGAMQMVFMVAVLIVSAIYAATKTGLDVVASSMTGINEVESFFGADGRMVALTFGIVTAVGLLAGPIGDPTFWQRAFSYRKNEIAPAFTMAALLFVLVPLSLSVLGFVAVARGTTSNPPDWINLAVVMEMFPKPLVIAFLFTLLAALLSTANAMMIALASLVSDYTPNIERQRLAVIAGLIIAFGIAVIPGNEIVKMFLVYSTLRSSHFLITVTSLSGVRWHSKAVFWGIVAGLAAGFPATVYGNMIESTWQWKLIALGLCSLVPLVIVMVAGRREDEDEEDSAYQTPGESAAVEDQSPSVPVN